MISVVIPTLNAESRLARCLEALVPAACDGTVKEVVVVDGGSTDRTAEIADGFGARVIAHAPGRGGQLRAGAGEARGQWLLFLHGDTILDDKWAAVARNHMECESARLGVFTLAFETKAPAAKLVSAGAMIRTRMLSLPYGDQGLFVSRALYDEIGGYRDIPLFEDVDIIRRLVKRFGRGVIKVLPATAATSAERYERMGYARCVIRNNLLLARFLFGASPEVLLKAYG